MSHQRQAKICAKRRGLKSQIGRDERTDIVGVLIRGLIRGLIYRSEIIATIIATYATPRFRLENVVVLVAG